MGWRVRQGGTERRGHFRVEAIRTLSRGGLEAARVLSGRRVMSVWKSIMLAKVAVNRGGAQETVGQAWSSVRIFIFELIILGIRITNN